jgi:hypothetical protein
MRCDFVGVLGHCKHAPLVDWIERKAESSAALNARCQLLLGKETTEMLDFEGSPKCSVDGSAQSTFSSRRDSGYSSIGSFPSRQTSPGVTYSHLTKIGLLVLLALLFRWRGMTLPNIS